LNWIRASDNYEESCEQGGLRLAYQIFSDRSYLHWRTPFKAK